MPGLSVTNCSPDVDALSGDEPSNFAEPADCHSVPL